MPLAAHGGDIYGVARRLGVSPQQIIDFSASINPLGISPRALRRVAREIRTVCHYPDPRQEELRALLAARQKMDPECIVFGNGATQLLYLVIRYFSPEKAVLVVPGFSENRAALASVQAHVGTFQLRPQGQFRLETNAFLDDLRRAKPDCVLLTNPNNPSGAVIPHEEIGQIAGFCRKMQIRLVVDESFVDFTREPSLSGLVGRNRFLIVIHSLTKFFALPGLRIGYLTAHRSIAKALSQVIEPWSVNTLAIAAAAESIKDRPYQKRTLALVAKEREYLQCGLRKLGWLEVYPSQVNFLLARSTIRSLSGKVLRAKLEQMHLVIRDSRGFGSLGPQFVRIAVRTRDENRRLLDALRVVGKPSVSGKQSS